MLKGVGARRTRALIPEPALRRLKNLFCECWSAGTNDLHPIRRCTMNKIPKRVHTFDTFWHGFAEMVHPTPEDRVSMRSGRIDKSFVEEIELIVSRVNGCRTCT